MDHEARLTRLEENLCFVETELKSLGMAMAEQQRQLDNLQKDLRKLEARFQDALAAMDSDQAPVNAVPPHHVARFW